MARAAAATGVDGIMVEVHPEPAKALSDGPQALTFPMFEKMMRDVRASPKSWGRRSPRTSPHAAPFSGRSSGQRAFRDPMYPPTSPSTPRFAIETWSRSSPRSGVRGSGGHRAAARCGDRAHGRAARSAQRRRGGAIV